MQKIAETIKKDKKVTAAGAVSLLLLVGCTINTLLTLMFLAQNNPQWLPSDGFEAVPGLEICMFIEGIFLLLAIAAIAVFAVLKNKCKKVHVQKKN